MLAVDLRAIWCQLMSCYLAVRGHTFPFIAPSRQSNLAPFIFLLYIVPIALYLRKAILTLGK